MLCSLIFNYQTQLMIQIGRNFGWGMKHRETQYKMQQNGTSNLRFDIIV